jgi:hypothetical protein
VVKVYMDRRALLGSGLRAGENEPHDHHDSDDSQDPEEYPQIF